MNIDVFCVAEQPVCTFLTFQIFAKISHALPRNMLENLGEVFKNNFLTAM